ncbi:MAG: glycosyltransferase [Bdellovibrionales bacterium]
MNILHVITDLDRGNTQKQLRLLAIELQKREVDQQIICLGKPGLNTGLLENAGIPVLHLNITHPVKFYKLWSTAVKQLGKFDMVCGWMYYGCFAAHYFHRKYFFQSPLVMNIRDSFNKDTDFRGIAGKIIQKVARLSSHADMVIYSSEKNQKNHEKEGYSSNGIVIPNGYDLESYDRDRKSTLEYKRRYRFDRFRTVFISVGDFNDSADFPSLLQAMQMNLESRDDSLFVLAGIGVDNQNRILRATLSDSAMERIWLLGDRGDVQQLLLASDYFVYSSKQEVPLDAVGEAMCAGLPCIVTDVGDAGFLVGNKGEVVPPNATVRMASAIAMFDTQTAEQKKAAKERVLERVRMLFSMAGVADQYHQRFLDLIQSEVSDSKPLPGT